MPKQHYKLPAWVWQILLMSLLSLSGMIFVPILLRWADPQMMASVLVAQVYVYYLVVLVQYGFALSGPAALARANGASGVAKVWRSSVQGRLLLLGPLLAAFSVGYVCIAQGTWYVWVFAILLWAYALNSNWWLQAQQSFAPAVGFAALGVIASALVVFALLEGYLGRSASNQGAWVVLVISLPQTFVGVGTWWVAHRSYVGLMRVARDDSADRGALPTRNAAMLSWLRTDLPLVTSQLLLLASTTLGTAMVGALADAYTTAAYAATEKLFNLAATVLVGLYMTLYPRLAGLFHVNRVLYWRTTQRLLMAAVCGGLALAGLLVFVGPMVMAWYLPSQMIVLVVPALSPLGLWLGLCISQHVLTSHLVLAERKHMVLWVNSCVLLATLVVGYACALRTPVAWVYGMVTGQMLALACLLHMCRKDQMLVI